MKVLLHPKFQDTYFCCLRDPELKFCTVMGHSLLKQLHFACTARGQHNVSVILPFLQGCHFYISWSPGECNISQNLTTQQSFDCTTWPMAWRVMTQNVEKKKHGANFASYWLLCGIAVAVACHQSALSLCIQDAPLHIWLVLTHFLFSR